LKKKLLVLGIVLALVAAMVVPMTVSASANTWYVGPGGVDAAGHGTVIGSPFASIGYAVSAASSGDTIDVASGTYTEPTAQIVIANNLTIIGAGAATTIIKPSADTGSSGDPRGWFLVNAGITFNLSNVTLNGSGHLIFQAIRDNGQGTVNSCTFTNIQYNQSVDYAGTGIAVRGGNVDVTNCTFTDIGRIGVIYSSALALAKGTFSNNTYTGKGIGNWLDYAVEVEGGTVTISNNTISNCVGVATVDGSTSGGIIGTTTIVPGTPTIVTITGNTIFGNHDGIAFGLSSTDTSQVTAHNNNLAGNTYGVEYEGTTSLDATNNWWGTTVSSAIAALVTGNVTYIPYLNSAPGSSGSGNATVSGTMPAESITVGAPSAISFGTFVLGMNGPVWSGTAGTVTAFADTWQVDVTASSASMKSGGDALTDYLQISSGDTWHNCAASPTIIFSYMSNPTSLPFEAQQNIVGSDLSMGAGAYTITITFTGHITN
jgi:hypothetical protein